MIASITSVTVELSGSTIKEKAESALREVEIHSNYLANESNLLWLRLPNGKGLKIQNYGAAILVSPGSFQGDFLYVGGLGGSEVFQVSRDDAQQLMARVIRRANKLEA